MRRARARSDARARSRRRGRGYAACARISGARCRYRSRMPAPFASHQRAAPLGSSAGAFIAETRFIQGGWIAGSSPATTDCPPGETGLARRGLSLGSGERPADTFQRSAFGGHAVTRRDECRGEHQHRAEEVAYEQAKARTGIDERAEQPGSGDAADAGTDGVEESDGERAYLERKDFADS